MVRKYITMDEPLNRQKSNLTEDLCLASENGDIDKVRSLIESGANIQAMDEDGITPLMYASMSGHLQVVVLLLSTLPDDHSRREYMNIQATEYYLLTALHFATESRKNDVAEYLITSGADYKLMDTYGWTVLMTSTRFIVPKITKLLLDMIDDDERKDYVNIRDVYGNTPLFWVVHSRSLETMDLLITAGGNIATKDNKGKSLLMTACSHHNNLVVVEKLLNWFTDDQERAGYVNCANNEGQTALWFAVDIDQGEVVSCLIANSADVSVKDGEGKTVLMKAREKGNLVVVKMLLDASKDEDAKKIYVETRDGKGRSAVSLAIQNGHHMVMEFLVTSGASVEDVKI